MFSLGLSGPFVIGFIFVAVIEIFAQPLVVLFGARMLELTQYAVSYLRYFALLIPLSGINQILGFVCSTYGYVGKNMAVSITGIVTNIIFSVLFIKTTSLGIGSLGLGSVVSNVINVVIGWVIIRQSHIPLHLKIYRYRIKDHTQSGKDLGEVFTEVNELLCESNSEGRVLLCTWHNYPDSYPEGKDVTIEWGYVWMFTDKEIASYKDELKKSKDPETRLKQLIGLPPDCDYTTVTGFWVSPENVIRPAYRTEVDSGKMTTSFDENVDADFKKWFDGNIIDSYFDDFYPWTRLGYTYDWADNDSEYGLTEFLVSDKAEVKVEFTDTTAEFIERITK